MKEFVRHIVKENIKNVAENSYLNYGVKGLHMINLIDTPTKGVKLYITDSNNNLQNSLPINCANGITYPFQQYGRNITVECIKGFVSIWTVEETMNNIALLASEYQYTDDGDSSVLSRENIGIKTKQVFVLNPGNCISLTGDEYINFGTRFGTISAWFVYEGREIDTNNNYFTNNDNTPVGDLYISPDAKTLISLLNTVGLI